ncbi:MAG: ABC transporter permease [Acidipropionibacterium sp.]|jgi:putative ABC transport system permease protein|nr:ABC transporter permease [Acidipropionibacterium sp.]
MFFWRMIGRALRRQMSKRLMIAVTILLGSSLTTSMLAVMLDVSDKVQAELGSYGANIQVLPKGASIVSDMYDVDSSASVGAIKESELPKLKSVFWAYNIEDYTPFLNTEATVGGKKVTVVGTWFDHSFKAANGQQVTTGIKPMRDWWHVTGSWASESPGSDSGAAQVMVGSTLAAQHGWQPGDTIALSSPKAEVRARVVGVYESGSDEDQQIFTSLPVAQQLAKRPGEVGRIEVRAITTPDNELATRAARDPSTLSIDEWETWYCTAYASSISYQIEEAMTNVSAKPVRQVADSEGVVLNKTRLIMTLVAVFAMVAAALGIANLVTASVMERSKEIGLMKALGARNSSIIATIGTETLIVAVIGAVAGFGVGAGLAQLVGHLVFGSGIAIRPIVAPLMALAVLVTVVLGCLPSMRYLLRLQPAHVLHGK